MPCSSHNHATNPHHTIIIAVQDKLCCNNIVFAWRTSSTMLRAMAKPIPEVNHAIILWKLKRLNNIFNHSASEKIAFLSDLKSTKDTMTDTLNFTGTNDNNSKSIHIPSVTKIYRSERQSSQARLRQKRTPQAKYRVSFFTST